MGVRLLIGRVRRCVALGLGFASVAAGFACGGSATTGDVCGPGTVADGSVCVPEPLDASTSDVTTSGPPHDAEGEDASSVDAGRDVEAVDAGPDNDAGPVDASVAETSTTFDAGNVQDAGTESGSDAGIADGGYAIGPSPSCDGVPDLDAASLIALDGGLREIVIDPCHAHVYVSDGTGNRIDDYSVASASLQAPIAVGSKPSGFDITPDGQRLYVANTGGTNISVVDLGSRRELTKVNFTSNFSGDTPLSLAISRNGKALFSTTFAGSGFGGRMMSLDLATQTITQATGFFVNGTTTEATQLKASADHAVVGIVAGDISSAPVFVYQASTGQFSNEHDLSGFVSRVAVSADGTLLLVDGRYVLDNALNLLGTIPGSATAYAAFGVSSAVAYRTASDHIDVLDTGRFLVTGTIAVTADTLQGAAGSSVGNLAASPDGRWLAAISDHGVVLVPVP